MHVFAYHKPKYKVVLVEDYMHISTFKMSVSESFLSIDSKAAGCFQYIDGYRCWVTLGEGSLKNSSESFYGSVVKALISKVPTYLSSLIQFVEYTMRPEKGL